MITAKTADGFEIELDENVLDDAELLDCWAVKAAKSSMTTCAPRKAACRSQPLQLRWVS